MRPFTNISSPLGTIWHAGQIHPGRKSYQQRRFEKSLVSIKSSVLFGRLTEAQTDISLYIMSQLLFGYTKIVNIQSLNIYQSTVQLLGNIHREMGLQENNINLDMPMTNTSESRITLQDDPYLVEFPFAVVDVAHTMEMGNDDEFHTVPLHANDITLSIQNGRPMEPDYAMEVADHNLFKDDVVGDMNQLNNDDEIAPGPSRQSNHPFLGMNDQIFSVDDNNNMDDYMDWSGLFLDFSPDLPGNISTSNRSNSSASGNQQVPVISPQNEHHDTIDPWTSDTVDVNSPLWNILGLNVSPPPTAIPPLNVSVWMDEQDGLQLDFNNDDNDTFVPQNILSPGISMQTDEYHQLVPRAASPTPPPVSPLRRRRRRLMDQDSTVLPLDAFIDTNQIVIARPPEEIDPLPTVGHQSRDRGLKQLLSRYRTQMQHPTKMISHPTNFWLREARTGRHMNTVIEQGRRLEHGRNRDPHSHDDLAFSNAGGDSETHEFSGADVVSFGQDHFDFDQMELVDDIRDRQSSNTSTSSARLEQLQQQLLQGRRLSGSSFGHPLTSSTASDRGQQGIALSDEPNYDELLEMGVDFQAIDFTGQEFYDYLRLATRDEHGVCVFETVYPKGIDGSKRSEVALGFYKVLACSTLNQIRPEQNEPYGPLYLHFLQDDVE